MSKVHEENTNYNEFSKHAFMHHVQANITNNPLRFESCLRFYYVFYLLVHCKNNQLN